MNIEIADKLVALRRERGLSQEELALKLGVSRQAVSKWERAESSPDTDNLIALARLYGVSLDALLLCGGGNSAAACAAAPEPEPEHETEQEPPPEPDEREEVFAKAAEWDAADRAVSERRRKKLKHFLLAFPYALFIVVIYLALGFVLGWWHPGWMLFMTVPIYYCLAEAL